jgi:hypothetical protein
MKELKHNACTDIKPKGKNPLANEQTQTMKVKNEK